MIFDQRALFALVSAVFVFLIWGKFRYDLVAFGALIVAPFWDSFRRTRSSRDSVTLR